MDKQLFIDEIMRLRIEKNAVILAHYYTDSEVQDIADYVGDSLVLAKWAAKTDADIIVMCGVNFMGETCKILCPKKKVLVLDLNAGCSLADSCEATKLQTFMNEHPGYKVVSYVNTTAAVKALSDVVVTSSNAVKVVESYPKDEKLIFGPDKNLGTYINELTGRDMLLWNGGCHVHSSFTVEEVCSLKRAHPNAEILVHPECPKKIQELADKLGSTADLLKYTQTTSSTEFIVATEAGVIHKMREAMPNKVYYSVGNVCDYMRLNTLEKLYQALATEQPEIIIDEELSSMALKPIEKMLSLS
ncbi:MAG: quinolinate synthase NadA [Prevotellaceae bacterium]|nr:quinolinate synthase NadA [Candidatus Colivivens equi]